MEVGNKDVYEYISHFADDKTVINMILANPKVFDNEKFYEKVMRKRYPLLIEFRKENETWKTLYLRMVYVLAKLQEDYQIPYIPTKGCSPERLLDNKIFGKERIYNEALICAAAGGHIQLIGYFLEKGVKYLEEALGTAGRHSNLNTVNYLISKGAKDYDYLFDSAAMGGNVEIMKFASDILKSEGWNINSTSSRTSLFHAINNERIEAINFLIQNGLIIRPEHIEYAEYKKKYDIAEYLKQFVQN